MTGRPRHQDAAKMLDNKGVRHKLYLCNGSGNGAQVVVGKYCLFKV